MVTYMGISIGKHNSTDIETTYDTDMHTFNVVMGIIKGIKLIL